MISRVLIQSIGTQYSCSEEEAAFVESDIEKKAKQIRPCYLAIAISHQFLDRSMLFSCARSALLLGALSSYFMPAKSRNNDVF